MINYKDYLFDTIDDVCWCEFCNCNDSSDERGNYYFMNWKQYMIRKKVFCHGDGYNGHSCYYKVGYNKCHFKPRMIIKKNEAFMS